MAKIDKPTVKETVFIEGEGIFDMADLCKLYLETKEDLDNANSCLSVYAKENEELKHQISELETELQVKEDLFKIKDAISNQPTEEHSSRPRFEWYEDRYQSDCITINQLHTTIDVLTDKLARLREVKGL